MPIYCQVLIMKAKIDFVSPYVHGSACYFGHMDIMIDSQSWNGLCEPSLMCSSCMHSKKTGNVKCIISSELFSLEKPYRYMIKTESVHEVSQSLEYYCDISVKNRHLFIGTLNGTSLQCEGQNKEQKLIFQVKYCHETEWNKSFLLFTFYHFIPW